jgi:protein SCO1/2
MKSALLTVLLVLALPFSAGAQAGIRPVIPAGTGGEEMLLRGVGVTEHLDAAVPSDATFLDHEGRAVRLGDIVDGSRPVLLHFVYYSCAIICENALNGIAQTLAGQPWTVGVEYDVITISMDPADGPEASALARGRVLARYPRLEAEHGWHFLTGTESEIHRVTDAVGYDFRWDEGTQQFAHPAVVMLLQRSGRVARYLYGLELTGNDVRLGLIEAAGDRTLASSGTGVVDGIVDRALLFCFRWDHTESRYVLAAWNLMRAGGILTALTLGSVLFFYWRRERRRDRAAAVAAKPTPTSPAVAAPRAT